MGWEAIRRIGGGAQAATHKSSPPMAKGHLGVHLRTPRQKNWGMEETKSPQTAQDVPCGSVPCCPPNRWRGRG